MFNPVEKSINKRNTSMNKMLRFLLLSLTIGIAAVVLSSCNDEDDSGSARNIAQLAEANDGLSTLEAALERFPDLTSTLSLS